MAEGRRWGEPEDAQLRALHGEGLPARQIASRMGWNVSSVSRHAARLDLSFDRSGTEAATRAAQEDAKARRTQLGLDILGDLEAARLRIGASESAREFQSVAQGMDALMRSYVALVRQEPDDGGMAEAQSLVGKIVAAVTMSVEGVPRLNPSAPKEGE